MNEIVLPGGGNSPFLRLASRRQTQEESGSEIANVRSTRFPGHGMSIILDAAAPFALHSSYTGKEDDPAYEIRQLFVSQ